MSVSHSGVDEHSSLLGYNSVSAGTRDWHVTEACFLRFQRVRSPRGSTLLQNVSNSLPVDTTSYSAKLGSSAPIQFKLRYASHHYFFCLLPPAFL